jgi:hypothetical protein
VNAFNTFIGVTVGLILSHPFEVARVTIVAHEDGDLRPWRTLRTLDNFRSESPADIMRGFIPRYIAATPLLVAGFMYLGSKSGKE